MKSRFLPTKRLWLNILWAFVVLSACFSVYQYQRETLYRQEIIKTRLETYNETIFNCLEHKELWPKNVRITILNTKGEVLFDNISHSTKENHLQRPEILLALQENTGIDIRRTSQTLKNDYFYCATLFKKQGIIVRTALCYNQNLISMLSTNKNFLWISILLLLTLAIIFKYLTSKAANAINKKLKQSKDDQTRLKQQLTQNIAHEIRTPVSSIQGFLDILVENQDLSAEQKTDFLRRAHLQSQRLSNLVRDISLLTQLENAESKNTTSKAKKQVTPSTNDESNCCLNEIFAKVIEEFQEKINANHANVINEISKNITISGNYSLIYSIFRNLLENSLCYAGNNTSIKASAKQNAKNVSIVFEDNGQGVEKQHLDYLFERFYRVDKGRSRKMGGTGLGLAIVKHAVQYHKGQIHAQTHQPTGLEFHFTLSNQ